MTEYFDTRLSEEAEKLGIALTEEKKEKLYKYYRMVEEKNKVMNLTAITDEEGFILKHITDSLAIVKAGNEITGLLSDKSKKVIDVGTGAGMPGVILKIYFPELNIVLFDSLRKRLDFLKEVISELKLENITTLHGRAEDIGRDNKYREGFDLAVSRAVANMAVLSEYCLPLVRTGGAFLPYKSGDIDEELEEAKKSIGLLGGRTENIIKYSLPDTDIKRSLVIVRKIKNTPSKLPRKAGVPAKEPLK